MDEINSPPQQASNPAPLADDGFDLARVKKGRQLKGPELAKFSAWVVSQYETTSIRGICRKTGRSYGEIREILMANGVTLRPRGSRPGTPSTPGSHPGAGGSRMSGAASAGDVSHRNAELERILLVELKWSLLGFAKKIREHCAATGHPRTVHQSTVARWCAGRQPGPELAAAACHVLSQACARQILPESLGWSAAETDVAERALHYGDVEHAVRMLRRLWQLDAVPRSVTVRKMSLVPMPSAVEASVMLPDTEIAGYGQRRVSVADIELLDAQTDLFRRTDARHGGGQYGSVFAAFLAAHAVPLLEGSFNSQRGRLLYGSVADAVLTLAGMAYDDELPGLAQRYALQAMRLAQAIGDRGRLARGCVHQARLAAVRGVGREVLAHAHSAVAAAADEPALVRAYVAVTEARAWAYNGDGAQCRAAVERARAALDEARRGSGPRWLAWLDRPALEGQAAWALAMAGLAEESDKALNVAMGLPPERTRDRVELLLTGAELARLRGERAEWQELLAKARTAARRLKSQRLARRLAAAAEGGPSHIF
ncbi:helix-turn-helix domain-containing protein [Streptomyces sp. CSDS2]|uniref:helix-turn-helix domain-containing protein n=1 Tax=Streptomyces sp. CSDS2 TaxID=3055051 RepID=UPI0025B11F58|nr:helix-turn-helix domain-containing protein [Streptomyces sp. CSDS2]MDN3260817.1 helix-turn-helix domain-containing protein [Streptomyces sp. CSDS2]